VDTKLATDATDVVLDPILTLEPELRTRGITELWVFGSRARGDHRPDSDLDVLVDYEPTCSMSLVKIAGIQNMISDSLGLDVHVTTRSSLKPDSILRILRFARRVF
jgi:uncharacterized protein